MDLKNLSKATVGGGIIFFICFAIYSLIIIYFGLLPSEETDSQTDGNFSFVFHIILASILGFVASFIAALILDWYNVDDRNKRLLSMVLFGVFSAVLSTLILCVSQVLSRIADRNWFTFALDSSQFLLLAIGGLIGWGGAGSFIACVIRPEDQRKRKVGRFRRTKKKPPRPKKRS